MPGTKYREEQPGGSLRRLPLWHKTVTDRVNRFKPVKKNQMSGRVHCNMFPYECYVLSLRDGWTHACENGMGGY